jgi:N-acetylornithine carbamoyltransferase
MKTLFRGKHFITDQEWDVEELETVFEVAKYLKTKFALGEEHRLLQDKTLFMIWFDKSTRTRNSFEAAMTQLGGHAHDLPSERLQISHGESAQDTAEVLSRYGHGIAIRHCLYGEGNRYIREVAKHSKIPVINMQCDVYHPCQVMADLFTLKEKMRKIEGKKFVVSWAYAPSYMKPMSVPQSLILLMPRFGFDVTLAHPPEFKLMPEIVEQAKKNAEDAGVHFEITNNMKEAFEGADVVYPKSWGCLQVTQNSEESMKIAKKYTDWICNEDLMALTNKHSYYMHCLPADRGYEVTDAVIDGPHSIVNDEAENRLHVQKAILALTMGGRP